MTLRVRTLSREEHLAFVTRQPSVSFLQTPAWGEVKSDWRSESIGWVDASGEIVGAGLALYRQVPRLRRYLAYLPEGPAIDWECAVRGEPLAAWLDPMRTHLAERGAFGIRMGPPVVTARWSAETLKSAIAAEGATRLADLSPDETTATGAAVTSQLKALGWRPPPEGGGFAAGQPRHVFQLPLAGRDEEDVLKSFNQLWRRNVKKAAKSGVEVTAGGVEDLPAFHGLYTETAVRDGFRPRPLSYFQRMWTAMRGEADDRLRLYLAHHEGDLVAATTMVRVGEHAWYSYGASSTAKREVRGSNAVQWQMIRDAIADGCAVYDLRGITDTLDEDDPHFGLIRFKLGTGGQAVEYAGEWDLPISRLLHAAFDLYMKRRG